MWFIAISLQLLALVAGKRSHGHLEIQAEQLENSSPSRGTWGAEKLRRKRFGKCSVAQGSFEGCCRSHKIFYCVNSGRSGGCSCDPRLKSECSNLDKMFHITNPEHWYFDFSDEYGVYQQANTYADLSPKDPKKRPPAPGALWPKLPGAEKYAVFLFPSSDWNGVFSFHDVLCQRVKCANQKGLQVVMRRVSKVSDVKDILKLFPDQSIKLLVLAGHGEPGSLQFDEMQGIDGELVPRTATAKDLLEEVRRSSVIDATVVLDSCTTAGTRPHVPMVQAKNVATYVANMLNGRQVVASKIPLSDDMFHQIEGAQCLGGGDMKFIDDENVDQTAVFASHPFCNILTLPAINEILKQTPHHDSRLCLSSCTGGCADSVKKWVGAGQISATLQEVQWADDVSQAQQEGKSCAWPTKRQLCKLVGEQ